jgi:hypothetical protein
LVNSSLVELGALIGIEDAGLAEPGKGLAQRLDAEPRLERVRQPPGQDPSGCPVDDRHQVQKPLSHRDVGYVSCPHLVRLVDRVATQKVRVDFCSGCRLLVSRFGLTANRPSFLISRRMRRRLTKTPSRKNATCSRRLP